MATVAVLALTGCGIKSSEYSASAKNVQVLKSYSDKKIAVDNFLVKKPGENSTLCRLAETIKTLMMNLMKSI